jgi:hypothetical protein
MEVSNILLKRNLLYAVSRSDGKSELITRLCRLLYRQRFFVYDETIYDAYSMSRRDWFKRKKGKGKVKVKVTLEQATKVQRGSRGTALLFL